MNMQKADKIRRSDEVADVIAKDIRSGVLGTGTWLKQVDVETRYRASRADIRRALEILPAEATGRADPRTRFLRQRRR